MENKVLTVLKWVPKLAKNTPNAEKFISPNCLPKPKVWEFDEKMHLWPAVVHDPDLSKLHY